MVVVPLRKKPINGKAKFLAKCDWQECGDEFWTGGRHSGNHFCPSHRLLNKRRRTKEYFARGAVTNQEDNHSVHLVNKYQPSREDRCKTRCPECGSVMSRCLC